MLLCVLFVYNVLLMFGMSCMFLWCVGFVMCSHVYYVYVFYVFDRFNEFTLFKHVKCALFIYVIYIYIYIVTYIHIYIYYII